MVIDVLALLLAFVAGSVPFSWLIARYRYGVDLREIGDGNVGGGNLLEHAGMLPGIAAMLLDIIKGAGAIAFAIVVAGDEWVVFTAGAIAIVGHAFPPWLGFAGGRGASPAIGVAWALFPLPGVAMFVFGVVVLVARRSTVAGIATAVVALVVTVFATGGDLSRLLFVGLLFITVGLKDGLDRLLLERRASG